MLVLNTSITESMAFEVIYPWPSKPWSVGCLNVIGEALLDVRESLKVAEQTNLLSAMFMLWRKMPSFNLGPIANTNDRCPHSNSSRISIVHNFPADQAHKTIGHRNSIVRFQYTRSSTPKPIGTPSSHSPLSNRSSITCQTKFCVREPFVPSCTSILFILPRQSSHLSHRTTTSQIKDVCTYQRSRRIG